MVVLAAASIPHCNDGGVAISVMMNEMRMHAGGDSRRPYVHTPTELIEMLYRGNKQLRFPAFLSW